MSSFKEREKLRREEAILAVAQALFAARGFEKVTLEEVAERVGVAKGTIYLHFASKDDLLMAILTKKQSELVAMLDEVANEPFAKSLEIIFKIWNEDLDFLVLMEANLSRIFASCKPTKENLPPLMTRLVDLVAAAQTAGEISPELHPSLVAFTILKPIPFRFADYLIREEGLEKNRLKANLCRIVQRGIGAGD